MKKRIAKWLVNVARRLDPQKDFHLEVGYEPKKLGLGIHITKSDVTRYAKENNLSLRKALAKLILVTKAQIEELIFSRMCNDNLIDFEINKGIFVADVSGNINVFVKKEEDKE